jgi:uncharacterized membrane protein YhaH (DUF805 family)
VSSRVTGRADAWWTRALPEWIHHPQYRLAYDFAERPPVSFDTVKSRLFAVVTANPQAYPGGYGRNRRQELRAARSLSDLIKSEEALAIERLEPTAWWRQEFFGEGRCSRRAFLAAVAGLVAVWLGVGRIGVTGSVLVAISLVSGAFGLSAVIRRLHDLRLSGGWTMLWLAWSMLCALIHDFAGKSAGPIVAGWLWWMPNLCIFGCLALWPGTRGPNRYGYSKQEAQRPDEAARSMG